MEGLVRLWLQGASPHTARAYRGDLAWWGAELGAPLDVRTVTSTELVEVLARRHQLSPLTIARRWATLRSLSGYAHRVGFSDFDACAPIRTRKTGDDLAQRILEPDQVAALLAATAKTRQPKRDRLIVLVLYYAAARGLEVCSLEWSHVRKRGDRAILTLHGKGDRIRHVGLPAKVARELLEHREELGRKARGPVFRARTGRALATRDLQRLVTRLARLAAIDLPVSPHWFRHAHATHASERGCPLHVITATLGHRSIATATRYLHARPAQSSGDWL